MAQNTRLLIVSDNYPEPANNGQTLKLRNLITSVRSAYNIHLLALDSRMPTVTQIESLLEDVSSVKVLQCAPAQRLLHGIVACLRRMPFYCGQTNAQREEILAWIDQHLTTGTTIHLDGIRLAPLLPDMKVRYPQVTISTTDAISLAYHEKERQSETIISRLINRVTAQFTARLEHATLAMARSVHVVSDADAIHLHHINPNINTCVIPICVCPSVQRQIEMACKRTSGERGMAPTIFISGSAVMPGVRRGIIDFVNRVWPVLKADIPDHSLVVLFRGADRNLLTRVSQPKGVKIITEVVDYPAEIGRHSIHIFPDKSGTGIKNRVINALLTGRPVVGTSTAFAGIPVIHGKSAYICETRDEFTAAIAALATDTDLAGRVGRAGAEVAVASFSLKAVGPRWLDFLRAPEHGA